MSASSTGVSSTEPKAPPGAAPGRSYGSGARILSIGIAATGLLTFAYFSIASHVLSEEAAQRLDVLWSVMFVVISVIYRPVEQLLSRTIAERRAHGHVEHPLRVPIALQAGFALVFLLVALALHEEFINHVFDGYSALYYVLLVGTLAYAGSYFARGWLAGHQYFGAVRRAGTDGVHLAHLLRARRRARCHERPDRGRAWDRGRTAGLAGRRARRVPAPRQRAQRMRAEVRPP